MPQHDFRTSGRRALPSLECLEDRSVPSTTGLFHTAPEYIEPKPPPPADSVIEREEYPPTHSGEVISRDEGMQMYFVPGLSRDDLGEARKEREQPTLSHQIPVDLQALHPFGHSPFHVVDPSAVTSHSGPAPLGPGALALALPASVSGPGTMAPNGPPAGPLAVRVAESWVLAGDPSREEGWFLFSLGPEGYGSSQTPLLVVPVAAGEGASGPGAVDQTAGDVIVPSASDDLMQASPPPGAALLDSFAAHLDQVRQAAVGVVTDREASVWVLAGVLAGLACELARRQLREPAGDAALFPDSGEETLLWSMSTH